ncbi:MAG: 50S ribosomal protein L25/general stress protein Ctc [Candidatus Ancillula sp.]|jgi:large subunit ribosomal protein L25|nr:50S ribosomal protein L25/general stress protein Ctc [Candidatus Ancillula sp.]
MADFKFESEKRNEFGKGFARRLRAAGRVPSVLYGGGQPALHISLPTHELSQAVRMPNALFEVKVDGKEHLALVKDVQRDFVTRAIEHVDLLEVKDGESVEVPVLFNVTGESKPGSAVSVSLKRLTIRCNATAIPRSIDLDITGAEIGQHFHVADLNLPAGSEVVGLPEDHVLVAIKAFVVRKEAQVDVAGGAPEGEGAEGAEGEATEEAAE